MQDKMGLTYEDVNPAENFKFTGKEIAYDIVYKPKYTKFLLAAEKAGCTLKFGWDMLMEQGKLQLFVLRFFIFLAEAL